MRQWSSGSFTADWMKPGFKIAVGLAVLGTTLLGCVGAPLSASEQALKRLKVTVAQLDGLQPVTIRFNPARCECPAFEAMLDGRWHRIEMSKDDESISALLEADAIRKGPGWTASVLAKGDGIERKLYRSPVIRIAVDAVCQDGECKGLQDGTGSDGDGN